MDNDTPALSIFLYRHRQQLKVKIIEENHGTQTQ